MKESSNSKYEDNIKVIENRWLFSQTMVDYFLRYFKKGFKIDIFDSFYKNVDLINMNIYKNAL